MSSDQSRQQQLEQVALDATTGETDYTLGDSHEHVRALLQEIVSLDGSAVDDQGRIYSTGGNGVQVIDKNGKLLGEIPSPLPLITVAFSGKDKKTLFGVANNQQYVEIFTIPVLASGYKGRAK